MIILMTLDNYGISAMTLFYGEVTTRVFTPTDGTEICDIDFVDRTVNVVESGMSSDEGLFTMSSSTPIVVTAEKHSRSQYSSHYKIP